MARQIAIVEDEPAIRELVAVNLRHAGHVVEQAGDVAAGRRLVDDVIEPADTRKVIAQALEYLHTKRELRPGKKHGLMPL